MWLNNLFKKSKKEETKEEVSLEIKDVEKFLKQISLEKEQSLIGEFNDIFEDIKILNKELLDYLIHFEEESLPNNIGDEEKNKINKTREIYSSKIRAILMNLNERINRFEENAKNENESKGVREIEGKIYQPFKKAVVLLAKNLTYEKMLLNNFFSNELIVIDKKIDELKELFEKINIKVSENSDFFREVDDILKDLRTFENNRILKIKKKNELPGIIDKYNSSKKINERVKSREEELKSNYPSRYEEYKRISDAIENLEKQTDEQTSKIRKLIIPLHKEFDLYTNIYKVKKPIVNGYLTNPLETFLNDETLEIIQILNKIASLIDEEVIKVDDVDEKIEQINDSIKKISELNREELQSTFNNLNEETKKEKSKIRKNKSLNDFDDIYYKIKHAESQFNYINSYVQDIKNITESIKLIETIKELEKRINEKLDANLNIILDEKLKEDDKNIII